MVATNTHIYLFDPMMPFVDENGEVVKNGFINVFLAGTSTRVNTYANYGGTLNPINIPLDDSGRVKNPVIVPIDYNYKVALMDDGHDLQNPIKTFDNINCSKVVNNTGSITQGLNSADNTDGQLELTVTDNKLTINGSSTFAKKTELDAAIEEIGDVSDELDAEASARAAADLVLLGKIEDAQGQSASHDYVDSAVAAEALARSNAVSSEASARSSADSALDVRVTALEQGGVGGVPEAPEDGNSYARKDGGWHNVGAEIDAIDEKIPSAASSSNQLADKAYVENMLGDLPVIVRNVSGEDKEVDTVRFVERSTGIGIYAVGENPSDYSGAVAIGSNDIKSENAEKALTVNANGDGVKFKKVPAITKMRGTGDEIEVGKLTLVNGASFASLNADGGTQMDAFTMYGINSNNINGTSAGHALVVNNTGDGVALRKVPTTTSDLTNDSGFITADDVPTKTSQLENDGDGESKFCTSSDLIGWETYFLKDICDVSGYVMSGDVSKIIFNRKLGIAYVSLFTNLNMSVSGSFLRLFYFKEEFRFLSCPFYLEQNAFAQAGTSYISGVVSIGWREIKYQTTSTFYDKWLNWTFMYPII